MPQTDKDKVIIGLVGEKLAGKDTVANFLVEKHGAHHVRFTHILDDILRLLNLPISRRNEIDLGLGLREVFGNYVLGNAVIKRAQDAKEKLVVINGIRMDEMEEIRKIGAKIVYLTATPEVRFKRYQERREKADDGVMDFDHFMEQEKEPTEIGIPALGAKADYKIVNEGSVEELQNKVSKIIAEISKS
jgi:dephospho-CoA kinase